MFCSQQREFPRNGCQQSLLLRKLRNNLGRAEELERLLMREPKQWNGVQNLQKKLHRHLSDFTLLGVSSYIAHTKETLARLEQEAKIAGVTRWRLSLSSNMKYRSFWLHRDKVSYYPPIQLDDEVAQTRQASLQSIIMFWQRLHEQVSWTDSERIAKSRVIGAHLRQSLQNTAIDGERPTHKDFAKAVKPICGTAGLDQWCANEAALVVNCAPLCKDIWQAMLLWEETSCTPSVLKRSKVAFVPKDGKTNEHEAALPNHLRPISVFSVWWRSWSSAWVKRSSLNKLKRVFGSSMGSLVGSNTLAKASLIDRLLHLPCALTVWISNS